MSLEQVELTGMLQADGTLVLDQKPDLSPGPVRVVVQAVARSAPKEDWWQYMERTRRELEAAGSRFMNEQEMNAHIEWLREGDQIDEMLQEHDAERQRQERSEC